MLLFVTSLGAKLPSVIQNTVKGISALNGPWAMLVLGVYLGQTDSQGNAGNAEALQA